MARNAGRERDRGEGSEHVNESDAGQHGRLAQAGGQSLISIDRLRVASFGRVNGFPSAYSAELLLAVYAGIASFSL